MDEIPTVGELSLLKRRYQTLSRSTHAPSVQALATLFIHVKQRGEKEKEKS